jgi:hypothetical protein
MRSSKNTRRIEVAETVYRWRATGQDGFISVCIWPENGIGALISGSVGYHRDANPYGDQLVVTNRLVKQIIEYVISQLNYNPNLKAKTYNLMQLEDKIDWMQTQYSIEQTNSNLINTLIGG